MKLLKMVACAVVGSFAMVGVASAEGGVNLSGTCYEPQGDGTTWAASCSNSNVSCGGNYGSCSIGAIAGQSVDKPLSVDYSKFPKEKLRALDKSGLALIKSINKKHYQKSAMAPCVNPMEPCKGAWQTPMPEKKSGTTGGTVQVGDAEPGLCDTCVFIFKRIENDWVPPKLDSVPDIEQDIIYPSAGPNTGGFGTAVKGQSQKVRSDAKPVLKKPTGEKVVKGKALKPVSKD